MREYCATIKNGDFEAHILACQDACNNFVMDTIEK